MNDFIMTNLDILAAAHNFQTKLTWMPHKLPFCFVNHSICSIMQMSNMSLILSSVMYYYNGKTQLLFKSIQMKINYQHNVLTTLKGFSRLTTV